MFRLNKIVFVLICFAFCAAMQKKAHVTLKGIIDDYPDGRLENVRVTIEHNGTKVKDIYSDKRGKFEVALEYDKMYEVAFNKENYQYMKLMVNTKVPPKEAEEDHLHKLEFHMIPDRFDLNIQLNPFDSLVFDEEEQGFVSMRW